MPTNYAETVNTGETRTYILGNEGPLNFVNIYTDDEALGELGAGTHRDTGVGRLLSLGTKFKNYRQVISLCEPSRVTELTGQYQQNNGINSNATAINVDEFFPDLFKKFLYTRLQGLWSADYDGPNPDNREYQTAHIGKWIAPAGHGDSQWNWNYADGVQQMDTIGLDELRCIGSSAFFSGQTLSTVKLGWQANHRSYDAFGNQIGADELFPVGAIGSHASPYPYSVDYIADQAVQIIDKFMSRPSGDPRKGLPFFMNIWPQAPHYPVNEPQQKLPLTSGAGAPPWASLNNAHDRTYRWQLYNGTFNDPATGRPFVPPFWDYTTYGFAADYDSLGLRPNITLPVPSGTMTDELNRFKSLIAIDDLIEYVLDRLSYWGVLGRTVISYISDNGFNRGEHGLWTGKDGFYDSGMRGPCVIVGPGFPAGEACDADVYNIDIAPTILGMAGIEANWTLDNGYDLRDIVVDPDTVSNRVVAICVGKAVSTDTVGYGDMTPRYKIWYTGNQFFDLQEDPWEMFNLYDNASHAMKPGNAPWGTPCASYATPFSIMQGLRPTMRVCSGTSCFITYDGVPA